jgi:hypothetical protein
MSKIFRLHSGASENIEHWQEISSPLTSEYIDSINDPSGLNANTQITSIPTPFARMDLVKTAFAFVAKEEAPLDGISIYHKMVSDCLDVAEIFFNMEALHDKIEILEWDSGIFMNGGELDIQPNSDLGNLLYSDNPKHKLLGETLKMYLFQDKQEFNFQYLKHIYLLNFKHGPEILNIIGGTSPSTLFFSSANDLSFVNINFQNDKVFDKSFCPLARRNKEFIIYFFAFRNTCSGFSEKFPELDRYLDKTFLLLEEGLKNIIRNLDKSVYENSYNPLPVKSEGNNAEILGIPLRIKNYGNDITADENDFILATTKSKDDKIPCVLPFDAFNDSLKYAGGVWQKSFCEKVPFVDNRTMGERTLPAQDHMRYPYLTVSDLLEPYLIRLPFPIDSQRFMSSFYEPKIDDHCFLLPLKRKIFEYFSIKDIQGTVADGKKMFELQPLANGIKAILRLPIKNNKYIQLYRIYSQNQFNDRLQFADESKNLGVIVNNQFTVGIYPFLRLNENINPHYRILFVDRDVHPLTSSNKYTVNYIKENQAAVTLKADYSKTRSNKQDSSGVTTQYDILENSFDFMEISNGFSTGIIIPLFKPLPGSSKSFKFAIDFGTTNTHIEYKTSNEDVTRPFEIQDHDVQIGTLHSPSEETENYLLKTELGFGAIDLIKIIKEEFIPFNIGKTNQYKFPQRTVINDNGRFNPNEANFSLADFNIPFWYLKEDLRLSSEITSNLKWADFNKESRLERRTRAFLKQLLLMIRNKVLLNGGDLARTEIVWFYPSSMPIFRRKFLQNSWEQYYERYIGNAGLIYKMSESFAPFYYYYNKENVRPHSRPAVNIDIGGGTTDIVIYKSEDPVLLSSFKFAANSIFGDGYGGTSSTNGFVQHFEGKIKKVLSSTTAAELVSIYDSIKQKNSKSIELTEFFFSLEDNKFIKDNRIPISFSKMLSEENDFKLVLIFFYSSVIYHIAKLMKEKNLDVPEYITFSGNGSKVINVICGGNDLGILLGLTKVIFEDVFSIEKCPPVEFRLFSNPKEITCKGGLESNSYSQFDSIEKDILTVLVGAEDNKLIPPSNLRYSEIENPQLIDSVCAEVANFIDKFFEWHSNFNYFQNFGINPKEFSNYRELLKSKLKNDLIDGIKGKMQEVKDNRDINIEETMFFYPLVGSLNRLAYSISQNSK